MTIAEKTASLTKVINETVKELEVTESSLDSQVTTAQGYETTAATHVTTAEGYRSQSLGHGSSIAGRLRTASQTASYSLLPEGEVRDIATNNLVDVFVYDTTKDSDGGAWRHRTQNTSWYDEADAPTGTWLGVHEDETSARLANLRTGPELVTNGTFEDDSDWTLSYMDVEDGVLTFDTSQPTGTATQTLSMVVGKPYILRFYVAGRTAGNLYPRLGSFSNLDTLNSDANGWHEYTINFTGGAVNQIQFVTNVGFDGSIDNVSVKEITDYGPEEITSGDFSSASALDDFSTTGTVTYDSGKARLQPSSELRQFLYGTDNVSGTYHVTWKQTLISGTRTRLLVRNLANSTYLNTSYFNGSGDMSAIVTTTDGVMFRLSSDNSEVQIDDISVRKIDLQTAAGDYYQKSTSSNFFKLNAFGSGEAQVYRGNRKEFPAVAVIVAEQEKLTIYDGDDPSIPMWMSFTEAGDGSSIIWNASGAFLSSVQMLNGLMVFGADNSSGTSYTGLYQVNFLSEHVERIENSTAKRVWLSTISARNLGGSYSDTVTSSLVDPRVTDVAMTVLPDAPIDDATGLPVPTIAVATDGGVSVIKDDGNIFDITNSHNTINKVFDVSFFSSSLFFSQGYSANDSYPTMKVIRDISTLTADTEITQGQTSGTGINLDALYTASDLGPNNGGNSKQNWRASEPLSESSFAYSFEANTPFITSIRQENPTAPDNGMGAFITSTYNTGWMVGDIKLAALTDTDDANLVGSGELVANGDFSSSDLSDWTGQTPTTVTLSYDAGRLRVVSTDQYNGAYQDITTVVGSVYNLTRTVEGGTGTLRFRTFAGPASGSLVDLGGLQNINNGAGSTETFTFVATSTTTRILFRSHNTIADFWLDDISVELADPNRALINNDLIVNGTITRSPVATGAELVSYSNFNGANYLQQEYNSNLDFGTGDFCMMVWAKDHGVFDTFLARSDNVNSSTELIWQTASTADSYRLFIGGQQIFASGLGFSNEGWHLHTAVRRSGSIYLYHDGEQVYTTSSVGGNSVTQSGAVLQVGIAKDVAVVIGADAFSGEMALLRISGTAPTAEQIKKIYEDERHLFKENAKCAIYGAEDEVKAFAYDKDTELLHAGTRDGVSSFSGLVRVDEKVGDITTAISAANGLIVED
jgi:trimeric autotransporter adhesin